MNVFRTTMSDHLLLMASNPPPIFTTVPADINAEHCRQLVILRSSSLIEIDSSKEKFSSINEETVFLSRLLALIHNRFHNDKGYKDLRMVEKTLKKFLRHDFLGIAKKYTEFLPIVASSAPNLPSRELLKHCLAMLYAAGAFLNRIEALLINSGLLAMQRLNLGHFWGVGAQQLACVSRLWALSRDLLSSCDNLYISLYTVTKNNVPDINEKLFIGFPSDLSKFFSDGINPHSVQSIAVPTAREEKTTVHSFLDLGEPVSRKEVVAVKSNSTIKAEKIEDVSQKSISKDVLGDLHSFDDLKQFLVKESTERKTCRKNSFTHKLNQEAWKCLKKCVLEEFNPKLPNKSLKLARKKIREALK